MALLTAASCGPISPDSPEEVRIELSVSGGIAGVSWSYTLDGPVGAVVGGECVRGPACDWDPGQILARFSAEKLRPLAVRFVESGFPGLERTDYGTQCCDQFTYVLTYRDADADRTVRGSDGTLPAAVLELVRAVRTFVEETREGARG